MRERQKGYVYKAETEDDIELSILVSFREGAFVKCISKRHANASESMEREGDVKKRRDGEK